MVVGLGWAVTIFVLPVESETGRLNFAILKNLSISNGPTPWQCEHLLGQCEQFNLRKSFHISWKFFSEIIDFKNYMFHGILWKIFLAKNYMKRNFFKRNNHFDGMKLLTFWVLTSRAISWFLYILPFPKKNLLQILLVPTARTWTSWKYKYNLLAFLIINVICSLDQDLISTGSQFDE